MDGNLSRVLLRVFSLFDAGGVGCLKLLLKPAQLLDPGLPIREFLRQHRLRTAAELLEQFAPTRLAQRVVRRVATVRSVRLNGFQPLANSASSCSRTAPIFFCVHASERLAQA